MLLVEFGVVFHRICHRHEKVTLFAILLPEGKVMKYLNIFFAIMFLAFAALQVNDPDPILWILIYGVMAVVSVMAIFDYYNRWLMSALAVLYLIYMIILFPGLAEWLRQNDKSVLFDDVMKMEFPYIEESREFLGLLINQLVLALCFFRSFHKKVA